MKFKTLAAAVALIGAASGANAALDNFASGNSSLAFVALDQTGTVISLMADLDFNLNNFLPSNTATPGTKIEWNFGANTLKVNNVIQAGAQTNWSPAFTTFNGTALPAETRWAVIAGDSTTDGGVDAVRYLSTVSAASEANVPNQNVSNLFSFALVDSLYNAANGAGLQTVATGLNAHTATAGAAYVRTGFGPTTADWRANSSFDAYATVGSTVNAYLLTEDPLSSLAANTKYAGTFNYSAGVLTYEVVAAPIPEPETYGMLLAGLGMIGFMARRRLNNRV